MNVKRNQVYRHYKGTLYKVLSTSTHTETQEQLVTYRESENHNGVIWTTPYLRFVQYISNDTMRFTLFSPAIAIGSKFNDSDGVELTVISIVVENSIYLVEVNDRYKSKMFINKKDLTEGLTSSAKIISASLPSL